MLIKSLFLEQLKPLIRDDSVTLKFVDSLYKKFQEVKTAHFQKSLGAAVKRSSEVGVRVYRVTYTYVL